MPIVHGSATEELRRLVKQLEQVAAGQHREAMSASLAAEAVVLIKDGFEHGHAPDGTAWKPLQSRAGQPLEDTNRLRNSFVPSVTTDGFEIEATNVKYAALQNYGGTIVPKTKKALRFYVKGKAVFAKKVTIPARQFLPAGVLPAAWAARFEKVARLVLARFVK